MDAPHATLPTIMARIAEAGLVGSCRATGHAAASPAAEPLGPLRPSSGRGGGGDGTTSPTSLLATGQRPPSILATVTNP